MKISYPQIQQQWFSVCIFPLSPDSCWDYRLDPAKGWTIGR